MGGAGGWEWWGTGVGEGGGRGARRLGWGGGGEVPCENSRGGGAGGLVSSIVDVAWDLLGCPGGLARICWEFVYDLQDYCGCLGGGLIVSGVPWKHY